MEEFDFFRLTKVIFENVQVIIMKIKVNDLPCALDQITILFLSKKL